MIDSNWSEMYDLQNTMLYLPTNLHVSGSGAISQKGLQRKTNSDNIRAGLAKNL